MTICIVAERAAVRAIPELLGHTCLPSLMVSHPLCQIVLAHRVDQPSMTSDMRGEERKSEGLQHVFEEFL